MNIEELEIENKKSIVQKGFTLIEAVVGIAIFAVLILGVVVLVSNVLVSSSQKSGQLADTEQGRKLSFNIMNELRNAQAGNDGSYALNLAQSQEIVYFTNADTDTNIERVRYYAQNGKLYKGLVEYNGATYPTSTEQSVVVQNNLANSSTTPLFYYYDGTYDGSSTAVSLTDPVNVTDVKFIKLNLQIYNKGGVKNTNYYTITAGGSIRNLKTNLGE